MAYAVTNPPSLVSPAPIAGAGRTWIYRSEDAASVVDIDGYITNGGDLGMQAGDIVLVTDTNADPIAVTSHVVDAINADGSADLTEGVAISGANTD